MEKKLAFGCMRLPMKDGKIDYVEFKKMVDVFIERGFTYFDTAHGYHDGQSEIAVRECLTKRYPHSAYTITDKLTSPYFKSREEIRPFFFSQLEAVGVDYFDYYLMHALSRNNYQHFMDHHAFEEAVKLKEEGYIKHIGLSFHDSADFLDKILNEHPEIEIVQIQFNYFDYLSPLVQSKACYDVVRKHNLPVLIMEPVKGGKLANLNDKAAIILNDLHNGTPASYAVRFAASYDGVFKVLSGMSNLEQLKDNTSYMQDFKPLNKKEYEAIDEVVKILGELDLIECTSCRYCVEGCPKQIRIPNLFNVYNQGIQFSGAKDDSYMWVTRNSGKASDCIKCGKCEKICPQHLPIRSLLEKVAETYE